jgi:hypothetical protein
MVSGDVGVMTVVSIVELWEAKCVSAGMKKVFVLYYF